MRKLVLASLFFLCTTGFALGQGASSYRYDNFDIPAGVRVESVRTTASLPDSSAEAPAKQGLVTNNSKSHAPLSTASTRVSASLDSFTTGDPTVDSFLIESGVRNGVDPLLLYAQMHQESSFKRGAISPKGARGLMQLMPFTAARFGVKNIFDPKQNIEGGARYMRFLLDHFNGDVALALAGYNAGEGAVLKYGRRIPPYRETQEYVRRISMRYSRMRDGDMARTARPAAPAQLANLQPEQPALGYQRAVHAVRLPDGRLQLVSQ